jgi:hypothetical protein
VKGIELKSALKHQLINQQ